MSGKILIVDDVVTNRIVLKVKLGRAHYQPLVAADMESCLRIARKDAPDIILLDHGLPGMTGIEVLKQIRSDPGLPDIPVVFLSSDADPETRMQALQAGADDFLQKPVDDQMLLARLRNLVRSRDSAPRIAGHDAALPMPGFAEGSTEFCGPGLIALVADRPETAMAWRRDLSGLTGDRIVIMTREDALAETHHDGMIPDIFVVEAAFETRDGGLRLMSELRSRPPTRHSAVCVICPDAAPAGAAMAYDLGANDVVPQGFNPRELGLRLRKLMRRKRDADRMRASVQDSLRASVIDPLTGLHNRRYAMPFLSGIAARSHNAGLAYSVLVIDLDRFKDVNDRWGHPAGDRVLVEVARRLAGNLRAGDLLARIGGEEFLVGLPDTGLDEAQVIAERLCRVVEAAAVVIAEDTAVTVTVSIGLSAGLPPDTHPFEPVTDVIERADRALMRSKSAGRNQVTISRSAA